MTNQKISHGTAISVARPVRWSTQQSTADSLVLLRLLFSSRCCLPVQPSPDHLHISESSQTLEALLCLQSLKGIRDSVSKLFDLYLLVGPIIIRQRANEFSFRR